MEERSEPRPAPVRDLTRPRRSLQGDDRGDVIVSWLAKLVLVFGLVGVAGFDALSVALVPLSLADQSAAAARAASATWQQTGNAQYAYDQAVASALEADAGNSVSAASFSISPDDTVTLTVTRTPVTLLAHRIAPLAERLPRSQTADGRSVS